MKKTIKVPIPKTSQPYNFDYFLTHYVFQPWVVEGKELVRLFKSESRKFVLVRVGFSEKPKPTLLIHLQSKERLTQDEEKWLVDMICWNFGAGSQITSSN